jgi:hypothetical protein
MEDFVLLGGLHDDHSSGAAIWLFAFFDTLFRIEAIGASDDNMDRQCFGKLFLDSF